VEVPDGISPMENETPSAAMTVPARVRWTAVSFSTSSSGATSPSAAGARRASKVRRGVSRQRMHRARCPSPTGSSAGTPSRQARWASRQLGAKTQPHSRPPTPSATPGIPRASRRPTRSETDWTRPTVQRRRWPHTSSRCRSSPARATCSRAPCRKPPRATVGCFQWSGAREIRSDLAAFNVTRHRSRAHRAGTACTPGFLMVFAGRFVARLIPQTGSPLQQRFTRAVPVVSAVVMTLAGAVGTIQGLAQFGYLPIG